MYRPTDKLVFVVLGMLSGAENVSEINTKVRPDRALLGAFGYQRCADASVIQQTLDATTEATVLELETALASMNSEHGDFGFGGFSVSNAGAYRHRPLCLADWQACRGCQERLCREKAEHLYPAVGAADAQ